jgi:hypothetical protein
MQPKNTIIFASHELYERPAKIAEKLRSAGYKIFLLYGIAPDPNLLDFFDFNAKVSDANELVFLTNKLNPKFVHIFSKSVDLFTQVFQLLNIRYIYDYKDLFEGLMKGQLNPDFLAAQRNVIKAALAITFRDSQFHHYLQRNELRYAGMTLHVPDQVLIPKNHLEKNKNKSRHKLCFSGYFTIESNEPHFAGLGQLEIIKAVLAQGFEYHMYGVRNDIPDKNNHILDDYINIQRAHPSFTLHDKLPLQDYIIELPQYSFGIFLLPIFHIDSLSENHYLVLPACGFAARLTDFISAGLPLIVEREINDAARFVEDNGVGIVLAKGELPSLREIVDSVDYSSICENAQQLGKRLATSGFHIEGLMQLYHNCFNR